MSNNSNKSRNQRRKYLAYISLLTLLMLLGVVFSCGAPPPNPAAPEAPETPTTVEPEDTSDITEFELPDEQKSNDSTELLPERTIAALNRATSDITELGNIVFNTPETMEIDESEEIELLLSPTKSIEELQSE